MMLDFRRKDLFHFLTESDVLNFTNCFEYFKELQSLQCKSLQINIYIALWLSLTVYEQNKSVAYSIVVFRVNF